jgi:uncharacterized protein (TIGR00251 family)
VSLAVRDLGGRVRFTVRVQPRASATEVAGIHGNALKVRLSAPPVDGAANAALIEFLSKLFAVPRRAVIILAGESSRLKIIEVEGITERAVHDVAGGVAR